MRDSTSCTEQVPYLRVKEIDFTSARRKKQRLEQSDDMLLTSHAEQKQKKLNAQRPSVKPSPEEIRDFYRSISLCGTKPAILSLIPEHADRYVPRQSRAALPSPLTNLFEEKNLQLNLDQLQEISKTTVLPPITAKVVRCVQEETVQQADSKLWFRLRAGRVTASRLYAVCHTNPLSPSRDLVLAVCYPEANEIQTPAIRWGIQNEESVTCLYIETLKKSHQGVCIMATGLHLNPKWPFLGATPDGLVTCSCCGTGSYEIKYPYAVRDQYLEDAVKTEFCLVTGEKGGFSLSKTHQYYYQVQAQLHVTGLDYCDFVVWTTKGIHVERIEPDCDFWSSAVCKAEQFFRNAVLPELLGKAFSRSPLEHRPCDQD